MPELFEDGSIRLNDGSLYVLVILANVFKDGSRLLMVSKAVIVLDK